MENLIQFLTENLSNIIKIVIIYALIIWVSIIIWTIKDVTHRSENIIIQTLSVLSVLLFPVFGVFVYLLIRPQRTLFEKHYEQEFREEFEKHLEASEKSNQSPKEILQNIYDKIRRKQ